MRKRSLHRKAYTPGYEGTRPAEVDTGGQRTKSGVKFFLRIDSSRTILSQNIEAKIQVASTKPKRLFSP
jgi:hypothetical protein